MTDEGKTGNNNSNSSNKNGKNNGGIKRERPPEVVTGRLTAAERAELGRLAGKRAELEESLRALERQLGDLNGRMAAVDKVTESVHRVTAALEQLKQQLSASKPAAVKFDDTQFVSLLS